MAFEKRLKKHIDSNFCVVGNSPIEIGKNKGKIIDSFKSIIRFNDFSLNQPVDYGSKINVWVRATNDLVIETINDKLNYKYDLIMLRAKSEKNEGFRKNLAEQKINYLIPPKEYEVDLSKELNAIPSTGILFLYILKENGYSFGKNVFGFSFFDVQDINQYGNHHYYLVDSSKISKGIALSKHKWEREKEFFNKIMEK
jgi:hypothetical protein